MTHQNVTTTSRRPPDRPSDEATKRGLQLANEAGAAYRRQVEHFIAEVAGWGAQQRAGEYVVGLAVEEAEPLYHLVGGELQLHEPFSDCNAHLEVVVMDAADGRFVPELDVHVHLWTEDGQDCGVVPLPFLWHPTMYHYGANVHLANGGGYRARVTIETPRFPRHDRVNGRRYIQPVATEFRGARVSPGRK